METQVLGRRLQWATIGWNSVEVFVTVGLGIAARSLALVAFGADSLIEVFASLVVIWHLRLTDAQKVARARRALRLVAVAFGLLAVALLAASVRSVVLGVEADSSPWGIAYLAATAVVMFTLAAWKRRVGRDLGNEPFMAEASMTFLDGCLASGVLMALVLTGAFGWWWADPVAALGVAAAAGRESVEGWREADRVEPLPAGHGPLGPTAA